MTQPEVHIRNYQHFKDYIPLVSLLTQEGMLSPDRDSPDRIAIAAERPGSMLVADVGGVAVGSVYIGNGDGIGLIGGLVIDAAHRGNGYGRLLMRAAEAELEYRSYTTAEILVDEGKTELMQWYSRQGYKVDYTCVGMVKDLQPQPRDVLAEAKQAVIEVYDQCSYEPPGKAYSIFDPGSFDELLAAAPVESLQPLRLASDVHGTYRAPASPAIPYGSAQNRWVRIPLQGSDYRLMQIATTEHGSTEVYPDCVDSDGWYVGYDKTEDTLQTFYMQDDIITLEPDTGPYWYNALELHARYGRWLKTSGLHF